MARLFPHHAAVVLLLALGALPAAADPWPAYRGPENTGRSAETGLLQTWPPGGPPELWRTALGTGYSGMAIVGDRLFTMFGDARSEWALCLDASTGREVWRVRTDEDRGDGQGGGPRSTPTVDGDRVFVLGARSQLYALDRHSGEVVWSSDLVRAHGARIPQWGTSASPLVAGDLLLVDVGGKAGFSMVAFHKATGRVVWHAGDDGPGYSTPLVATVGSGAEARRLALFFTGTGLSGVDLESGRLLWRFPWQTAYDVNAAAPVFLPPDRVFISSGYDSGAAVLRMIVDGERVRVEEVWRSRDMKNHFNSSVLVGEHLYGFDNGTLKCLEAATGREVWAHRGFAKGSLIAVDGHLVVLGERGQLALVAATPSGYVEKASAEVFSAKTWTAPALADGRLFLRSEKELVALDLRPDGT